MDLDRDRIKTVLREAYRSIKDLLSIDYQISEDSFVSGIDPFLDSNRVSIPVNLHLPSKLYPEMVIEVNLRQKAVFARLANRKIQARINHYLKVL